jgi:hypothetical protein
MEAQPNPDREAWIDKLFEESDREVVRILSQYLNKEHKHE